MKNRLLALMVAMLLLVPSLGGCEADYQKFSVTYFDLFDSVVTIIGFAKDEAIFTSAANAAQEMFARLHMLYDNYTPYPGVNNLYALNARAKDAPMQVERELFDLLAYCKEMQPLMRGAVNIAMGAVLEIWHEYREEGLYDPEKAALPPMEALLAANAHTDYDDVHLDAENSTVYFADPKLKLDVGAVGKGYAAQLVGDMLRASDMPSFIMSVGGNIVAGDAPKDGRLRWGTSVQDPDGSLFSNTESDIMDVLYFTNLSAVTSGDYQRYYIVDDVKYHHIIAPDTLMPSTHCRSVTVVCADSALADLLSTALFILPYEDGLALIDSIAGAEVIWMFADRTVRMSTGMEKYARSHGATSR